MEIVKKRPGRPPGGAKTAPLYPDKVRRIVELRDVHGMTYDQISEVLSKDEPITWMAVWQSYKKWRKWVYAEGTFHA